MAFWCICDFFASHTTTASVCATIGAFVVLRYVVSYTRLLLETFVLSGKKLSVYGANSGDWALVTGASDGIGKEFAKQLAKKGFNIALISRSESKLAQVSEEIKEKYDVSTKFLPIDFTDTSENNSENYKKLEYLVNSIDISVLVNNVGVSHSIPVSFNDTDVKEMENIINVNNLATLKVSKIVIDRMISRRKEAKIAKSKIPRGLIITMGSFGGLIPTPYLATYSGSKAFLQQWSSALSYELAPYKIDCDFVISYLVTSAMSKIRRSSNTIPNPRDFVKSVLSSIGKNRGAQGRYATSTPFWSHALMEWWIENTVGLYSWLVLRINGKMHKSIRARALKKAAKSK